MKRAGFPNLCDLQDLGDRASASAFAPLLHTLRI